MFKILQQMRADGWRVAVHNDYTLNGDDMTFWLFTHPSGLYVKGEGHDDFSALLACSTAASKVFAPSP